MLAVFLLPGLLWPLSLFGLSTYSGSFKIYTANVLSKNCVCRRASVMGSRVVSAEGVCFSTHNISLRLITGPLEIQEGN